jgi:hypothetical protein
MTGLLAFNLGMLLLIAAAFARLVPRSVSGAVVEFLHMMVGITTPTGQQVRVVLIVWFVSALAIVDGMAFLMQYVF